ncbi:hypothetical protein Pmani_029836 [Petrolisthes manimaculis]|uniref:Uncharacterized protein n=1 Tax=Petrolisthes manimaculis TaxID=1843537 RepID=A0AAE1NZD3_9EUCA|nr:hypothetical protein Pmani_029836 [Petrolisthes manimaculis]
MKEGGNLKKEGGNLKERGDLEEEGSDLEEEGSYLEEGGDLKKGCDLEGGDLKEGRRSERRGKRSEEGGRRSEEEGGIACDGPCSHYRAPPPPPRRINGGSEIERSGGEGRGQHFPDNPTTTLTSIHLLREASTRRNYYKRLVGWWWREVNGSHVRSGRDNKHYLKNWAA